MAGYSAEIRAAAIAMYIGGASGREVVQEFRIGSTTTLETWVARHRAAAKGEEFPDKRPSAKHSDTARRAFMAAIDEGYGYETASRLAGVPISTGWSWLQRYRLKGTLWLAPVTSPRSYSSDFKVAAVTAFLKGSTRAEVLAEFKIDSSRSFDKWVSKYRRGGPGAFSPTLRRPTVEQLMVENAALATIVAHLDPNLSTTAKVEVVAALADRYPIRTLLKSVGLPRSTYYYRRSRPPRADTYETIRPLIRESFEGAYRSYGYRRVRAHLRLTHGVAISGKTVRRLMREEGCVCRARKRRTKFAKQGTVNQIAPNVLERDFAATAPNQKWVTDVTQFVVAGRLLYVSPLIDLYNGEVISYTLRTNPTMPLVLDMLSPVLAGLGDVRPVLHSDQGWQYQHGSYRHLLEEHRVTQSMSRKGNCHDNAAAESFFSHLKQEFILRREFASVDQFAAELDRYMRWYNNDRIREKLGWRSPVAYRTRSEVGER